MTPTTFAIPVRELSNAITDEAERFTRPYTVPMFYRDAFVGSGTLIAWDGSYGILTAQHIPQNPDDPSHRFDFNSRDKLGLSIAGYAHRFEVEMQHLSLVEIGRPISRVRGPDLATIVLPSELIGALKAKLSFWNISVDVQQKIERARRRTGFSIVAGSPAEWVRAGEPDLGMSEVTHVFTMGGLTGVDRRYKEGGFDFLEIHAIYGAESESPECFRGVSGGGIWQVNVRKRSDTDAIEADTPVLAGVAFYQGRLYRHRRLIRCNGPCSIYERTLTELRRVEAG